MAIETARSNGPCAGQTETEGERQQQRHVVQAAWVWMMVNSSVTIVTVHATGMPRRGRGDAEVENRGSTSVLLEQRGHDQSIARNIITGAAGRGA